MKAFGPGIIYCTIKMHYRTYIHFEIFSMRTDVGGTVIVILKRDDLPQEPRHRAVQSLEREHVKLSPELIEQAELVVFVEGTAVKFQKYFPEIHSRDSVDVLMGYITSTAPTIQAGVPWSRPRQGSRRKRK